MFRQLGKVIAWPKLHAFRIIEESAGQRVLIKRRRLWADLLVAPANRWVLRGSGVQALSNHEALVWEREVHRALGVVLPGGGEADELRLPLWPGETLARLMGDANRSWTTRRSALDSAIAALGRLHQVQACWPDGRIRPLSHGDAVAKNAIVDLDSGETRWIDFDMRHDPALDPERRRADDLRALIFSVAVAAGSERFQDLADAWARSDVIADATRERFQTLLRVEWQAPSAFRFAQAPLSSIEEQRLREILLAIPIRSSLSSPLSL